MLPAGLEQLLAERAENRVLCTKSLIYLIWWSHHSLMLCSNSRDTVKRDHRRSCFSDALDYLFQRYLRVIEGYAA